MQGLQHIKDKGMKILFPVKAETGRYRSENFLSGSSQKGSVLIGLIITMIVMVALGAGMHSLTTTSTMNELSAGNHSRAYYTAESGGRYAISEIRKGKSPAGSFRMSNGDEFKITILSWETDPDTGADKVTFYSTSTVSSGPLQAQRRLKYGVGGLVQAGSETATIPQENIVMLSDLADASGNTSTGNFETVDLGGEGDTDTALKITQTTSGSSQGNQPSTEAYVSLPSGSSNPIYLSWDNAGSYLSYDIQAKVATGDWDSDTNSFSNKPYTYCAGIMFRAGTTLSQQSTFYGLSYMRSKTGNGNDSDGIADSMLPVDSASEKAMLILWTRNGNQGNGDDNWLAYKFLDETSGSDYVIDNYGHVKDWSTILARVIEAASVKLTVLTAPDIHIGDIIAGASGSATAKVVRKINDSDGKVVLLLNNVDDGFTRPTMIDSYYTDSTWGYRPRDNYIWGFYADTASHSTPDETPLNNDRDGNSRGRGDDLKWPVADVQAWTADTDNFSLVQWNATLNTGQDASLHRMGAGKDANGIIRTNKWTTEAYEADDFPPEMGVVSLGENSVDTYFDDLAYYLHGKSGSSGGGSVIQY